MSHFRIFSGRTGLARFKEIHIPSSQDIGERLIQTVKGAASPISAAKTRPEALPLPARLYTTQRTMDVDEARDMHYGDLGGDVMRGRFFLVDIFARVNPLYPKFRIFWLWFTLQQWNKYGYRPFITKMIALVDINGRRGE